MNKICISLLKKPTAPLYRLSSHLAIKSNVDSKKKKKKNPKKNHTNNMSIRHLSNRYDVQSTNPLLLLFFFLVMIANSPT